MTIISDGTLFQMVDKGELGIEPFMPGMIQPSSIDVCASGHFRVFRNDGITHIDPGFDGTITLELSNNATLPICLRAGMPIGQVSFQFLDKPCQLPYGAPERNSKYQGQVDPTASKIHENFSGEGEVVEAATRILPPSDGIEEIHTDEVMQEDPRCIYRYIGGSQKPGYQRRVTNSGCPVHGITP
jgi:hypothetical protein